MLQGTATEASRNADDWPASEPPRIIFWSILAILLAAALVQIYAGLELLGLRWDGGPFLRDMLSARTFVFYEQPRQTTQVILELPVVMAMRLGITDVYALSAIWSLTLQLAPLVLTCASYFVLPKRYKIFFVLPVFHYFAGASNVASAGLIEGPTAAAYFWVLLYLLLFATERWPGRVLFALCAIPALFLHEVMAILGPVLAYAAWWRSRQEKGAVPRLFLLAFAVFFLVVTVVQIRYVLVPTSVRNRDGFITQLFGFQWLWTAAKQINVPVALGLLAGLAMMAMWRFPRHGWSIVGGFAGVTLVLLGIAHIEGSADQFYARNHPAIILLPMAAIALAALHWQQTILPSARSHAKRATAVLVVLASATLLVQAASVRQWADYVGTFRNVIANRHGLIAWEDVMKEIPGHEARRLERMNFPFANPDMSLLLSPNRRVQSILMNPSTTRWGGWQPQVPEQLPKGWTYEWTSP